MMSPADNSNIVFYAYKTGSTATIDYEQYLIKDYVTEYVKNNSEIYCFDTNFLLFDTNFFRYSYNIDINNYSGLPDACEKIYNLNKYIDKKLSKKLPHYHSSDFAGHIHKDDWTYDLSYTAHSNLDEFISEAQYRYAKHFRDIEPELRNVYKPENLELKVNGKIVSHTSISVGYATYNTNISEYEANILNILDYVDNIEVITDHSEKYMIYNGKKYKFHYTDSTLKKNDIPYICRMSYLEEVFNAKIKYDYDNLILEINI